MKRERCFDEKREKRLVRAGRVFSAVGMPEDADGRMPVVTVTGGRFIRVEHHSGVLLFTDRRVRLYSRIGIISIEGRGLKSKCMDPESLALEGEISSVCFEK